MSYLGPPAAMNLVNEEIKKVVYNLRAQQIAAHALIVTKRAQNTPKFEPFRSEDFVTVFIAVPKNEDLDSGRVEVVNDRFLALIIGELGLYECQDYFEYLEFDHSQRLDSLA